MSNNNDGFSSLDPLGPEYGRINAPVIDSKGLSSFEGDRLSMPKINFPTSSSFFPTLPDVNNLEQPQGNVRQNLVKQPMQKPGPNKKASFQDIKNAIRQDFSAVVQSNQDKNSYAKIYSYDAGPDSNAFYKRYQAYGQDTFDKIGFSPLRDNESLYNSRTTMWDDTARMFKHSFIPLFTSGFVSGPKSLMKMIGGDFTGTDLEDADLYKEAAAIGQSSKGGLGGFANNMVMNFGYSAGIMGEALVEELAGALLAPETLGGSLFLTTANNLRKLEKIGHGLDMAVDGYKAVNTTLKTIDEVSAARKFWQNAKKIGTSQFNPLQNTFQAVKGLGETVEKGGQLYNFTNLARGYKTMGGFYKDVRNINMALSEARLEAGMVQNQVYDNIYNKYYRENGKAPDDATQHDMMKQAKEASINTLKWNTALIYGSNAITFPNIVGPKGGIPNFMRNSIREVAEIGGGKFGKLGSVVYDRAKKDFMFKKDNFLNMVKDWGRQPVYKSLKGTVGYFKENFTEGVQESLQEVISGANEKYYSDSFQSPALKAHLYAKGVDMYNHRSQSQYFKDELKNQFTGQGFDTFASGFFMGSLATPINSSIPYLSIGYNRIFNKGAYQEYKATKSKIANDIVNNLKAIDINDFLNARVFNYGVQDLTSLIKQKGSTKEAIDASDESFINQMNTILETDTMDVFRDKLKDLKNLSPEEIEENIPNIPKGEGAKYLAKIDGIIDKTKKFEQRYKYFNEKFPNPVTADTLPPKDSPEYEDAIALHHGWKQSVNNAVYFNQTFDNLMERKKDIVGKFVSKGPLKSMSQRDAEVLFDFNKLTNEIAILREEIKNAEISDTTYVSPDEQNKRKRKLEALENLAEHTSKYRNFFNRYEKADEIRKEIQKQKGTDEPVTDQEVEDVLNHYLGEANDDNKIEHLSNYKQAFTNYLKAVADVNDDYVFDRDIDEAFDKLADYEKLNSEGKQIMKYINLLHDPGAFMENAQRNKAWMKELYKRRGSIYENIVSEQLEMIENNALLNALANQGIYVSVDDFAEWLKNGTPPKEFYDHTRKMIIPEGTEEYEKYYSFFEQAAELKEKLSSIVPDSLDKQLQDKLDDLDRQMEAEIANVPKKDVKVDIETIYPDKGDKMTAIFMLAGLNENEYVEADYGGSEPLVFFKDENGIIRLDDKDGDEINVNTISIDFKSGKVYKYESQPDPELVKPIQERYENLKNEAKQDYINNKLQETNNENKEEFVPITTSMEIEELQKHKDLYNALFTLFNDKYLSKLSTEEDIELSEDPVKMRNAFTKFLQTDLEVKKIINDYNNQKKLDEVTQETGEKDDFEFIYQGKKHNTTNIKTVYDLRKMQRRFKNLIAEIEKEKEPTPEQITNKSNYMVIVNDLEKLIATRSKKGFTPELQEAIKKIQELKDRQGEIEQTPAGYIIDGEVYKRVTTVIQELKNEKYEYKDANAVAVAFYNNIGDNSLTAENINNFIQALRVSALSGFSEYTYNELQKELENILNTGILKTTAQPKIFSPNKPEIKEEDNIVFGAAGKMRKDSNRQNQDALFVDKDNGLFIVADGMGGVDKVPFFQPHDAAKLMINEFRGIKEKNPFDIVVEAYKNNNNITVKEVFELLQNNNYIPKTEKFDESSILGMADPNIIAINGLLRILKNPSSITSNDNWLTRAVGAVGVKAQKIGNNKYEIEHVGDAVFFVIDKNNNIKQVQGLSTSPYVDGFTWGIDANGEITADPAKKISKYVVELKPGERLVLSSDFIETKAAIEDFINSGLGKNLNFDDFRNKHKNDDASFISIGYEDNTTQKNKTSLNNSDLLKRIQQVVSEKTYEESRISGNYIDEQIKRLFDGSKPIEFDEDLITQEAYNNLFGIDGFLTKLKQRVDNGELYIVSQGIRVFDKQLKIAGEIDLLVADTAGNITIVDVKTGEKSKWDNFKKKGNKNSKMEDYQLQQTAYANLLDRMIGYNPKVALLPVQMTREKETGKILTASKPTSPTLLNTDFLIFLDKEPVQERIDSIIPRPDVTPTKKLIEDTQEYKDLVTKLNNLEAKFLAEGKSAEEATSLALNSISEEERDLLRRSYQESLANKQSSVIPVDPQSSSDVASPTQEVKTESEIKETVINEELQYTLDDFNKDLQGVDSIEELRVLKDKLSVMITEERITLEDIEQMSALFNQKVEQIKSGKVSGLNTDNLKEGVQLVSKMSIFDGVNADGSNAMIATEGSTFVVNSVNTKNNTVSISLMGETSKLDISFDKLNEMFILKDNVMDTTTSEPTVVSKEEKELLTQSADLTDDLIKNAARLEQLEKAASNKSLEELDSELFNDLKC